MIFKGFEPTLEFEFKAGSRASIVHIPQLDKAASEYLKSLVVEAGEIEEDKPLRQVAKLLDLDEFDKDFDITLMVIKRMNLG